MLKSNCKNKTNNRVTFETNLTDNNASSECSSSGNKMKKILFFLSD